MRGRFGSISVVIVVAALSLAPVMAAAYDPPAGAPSRSATKSLVYPFPLGPTDSLDQPKPVSGTVTMFARPSRDTIITAAEFFVDGKSVGKAAEPPFKLVYDASKLSNGEHIVKAVGTDAQGKEVWSASAKAVAGEAAAPPVVRPRPATATGTAPAQPGKPVKPSSPALPGKRTPTPSMTPGAVGMQLTRTYNDARFGFSISYPQAWVASDKSADLKPRESGNAWIVFGTAPVDNAEVVVNVKRRELQQGTDAGVFARYNSYVNSWKRTSLLGSSAFITTDGKPENKRVIHRAIIIKDGCAWMLNCIDTTGKRDAESKKLFDSMIETLSTLKPAQPTVTITEVGTVE